MPAFGSLLVLLSFLVNLEVLVQMLPFFFCHR
jgi:hypothetical protein